MVNIKITIQEFIEQDFNFPLKAVIYKNMKVALKAFEQFKIENEQFFSLDKKETVFGYLRNYCIDKQFYQSAFNKNACYSAFIKQVNKPKYKTLFIETKHFVLNINRTKKAGKLPITSAYRKELAKRNIELTKLPPTQLTLFPFDSVENYCSDKNYALITYGYNMGNLTHLDLLIPSDKYELLERKDFLKDIYIYMIIMLL